MVSQLARQHVTVSLSGDAGDELFCGYNRYSMTASWWHKLSRMPLPLRRLLAGAITAVPPGTWDKLGAVLPMSRVGDKLHKGAALLGHTTVAELYRGMVSHWPEPDALVFGAQTLRELGAEEDEIADILDGVRERDRQRQRRVDQHRVQPVATRQAALPRAGNTRLRLSRQAVWRRGWRVVSGTL